MTTQMLFKYRSISSEKRLMRTIESINNHSIFFPTYDLLNDPLEGSGYVVEPEGYAGKSIRLSADEEDRVIHDIRSKYHILSLSETYNSPSMWAHYAEDYTGLCIGYWTRDAFSAAQPLNYVSEAIKSIETNDCGFVNYEKLEAEVYKGFFYKHTDWKYENEWRIVKKQEENYFTYHPNDLACVIFGNNVDKEILQFIRKNIRTSVPLFKASVGYRTFGINIMRLDDNLIDDRHVIIREQADLIRAIRSYEAVVV